MDTTHSVIIGGGRGIGRATVDLFAETGHRVSVLSRRAPYEKDAERKNVVYYPVDLSKPDSVTLRETLETMTEKDGPVTNLAFFQRYRGDDDPWQGEIAVSLTATKTLIDAVQPRFAPQRAGAIIVIGSVLDRFIAADQPLGYHVIKAALSQLVRYYAVQLGPLNIRVNGISPAVVVKEESEPFYTEHRELSGLFAEATPLGRMCRSEDIAHLVAFLCSDKAAFITGQNIVIDGGLSLHAHAALAHRMRFPG